MKKIIMIFTLLTSMTSFAAIKTYKCQTVPLDGEESASISITLDNDLGEGSVTFDGDIELGYVLQGENVTTLMVGGGADTALFNVYTIDTETIIKNYIKDLTSLYSLTPERAQEFENSLKIKIGDAKVNATMVVLDQISSFLICK
jgi:hypothetical protein